MSPLREIQNSKFARSNILNPTDESGGFDIMLQSIFIPPLIKSWRKTVTQIQLKLKIQRI